MNFPWKLKFYHWKQILSVVFLEVTGLLHYFSRKCLPNTQVWIAIICLSIVLSNKNGVSWKKWPIQLTIQTCIQMLLLRVPLNTILQYEASTSCILLILTQKILKRWILKGKKSNKSYKFYFLIKDDLQWNLHISNT